MAKAKTQNKAFMGKNADALLAGAERQLRQPSLRQRRLFVELTRRSTIREAMDAAGYSHKTGAAGAIAKLSETTLKAELEEMGFNPREVARRIMDGLDGMMIKPLGRGEWKEAPDWTNRHRYLSTALRMFGVQVSGLPRQLNVSDRSTHLHVYKQVFNLMENSMMAKMRPQQGLEVLELDEEETGE